MENELTFSVVSALYEPRSPLSRAMVNEDGSDEYFVVALKTRGSVAPNLGWQEETLKDPVVFLGRRRGCLNQKGRVIPVMRQARELQTIFLRLPAPNLQNEKLSSGFDALFILSSCNTQRQWCLISQAPT